MQLSSADHSAACLPEFCCARLAGINIYERSDHDLDSRGGGIVLQPDVVEAFQRAGIFQPLGGGSCSLLFKPGW